MNHSLTTVRIGYGLLAIFISGCASHQNVSYPDNWPRLKLTDSCKSITGLYLNSAYGKTSIGKAYLSSLLRDGLDASSDTDDDDMLVDLDAEKLTLDSGFHGVQAVGQSLKIGRWSCELAGVLTATFDRDAPSEGSVGNRAKISVRLSMTDEGFLEIGRAHV